MKISHKHLLYEIPNTHTRTCLQPHAYLRFVLCISTLFHHNSWMPWRCSLRSRAWNFSMCNQVQLHAPAQPQRSSRSNNITLKCLQTFESAAETLRQQARDRIYICLALALVCCQIVAEECGRRSGSRESTQGISYLQPHTRLRFLGRASLQAHLQLNWLSSEISAKLVFSVLPA